MNELIKRIFLPVALLSIISCSFISRFREPPLEITKTEWSFRQLRFVEHRYDESLESLFDFKSVSRNQQYKYKALMNQTGTVLGLLKENHSVHWIIELENGKKIKTLRHSSYLERGFIPFTYFVDDLEKVKNSMIGKNIWLNYIPRGNPTDVLYSYRILDGLRRGEFHPQPVYRRFEKVKVIDVIPFLYENIAEKPLYLKIQTETGGIGYILYTDDVNKYQRIPYFITDPLPPKWGPEILTLVKNGNVKLGMTKEQVRVSWGNPTNEITVGNLFSGLMEQWMYPNSRFVYFKENVVYDFLSN